MSADIGTENNAEMKGRYGEYAGFTTRLVAFVIDIVVLIVAATIVGTIISLLSQFLGFNQAAEKLLLVIAAATTLSINLGYFIVFWMLVGMTPGMRVMGLLVIAEDGGRVTIGMAIRRYIGYFVSAVLLLGYLWVLIDKRRQGFHDKLAGTLVIYDWPDKVLAQQDVPSRRERRGVQRLRDQEASTN